MPNVTAGYGKYTYSIAFLVTGIAEGALKTKTLIVVT